MSFGKNSCLQMRKEDIIITNGISERYGGIHGRENG